MKPDWILDGSDDSYVMHTMRLCKTWESGNRIAVIDALDEVTPIEAARTTMGLLAFWTGSADPENFRVFEVLLNQRINEQRMMREAAQARGEA